MTRSAAFRRPGYRGWPAARLWRTGRNLLSPLAAVVLAAVLAGCAFSYQLGSTWGKDGDTARPPLAASGQKESSLPENDLHYARAAVAEALAKAGSTQSTPWENPKTGARGMVTPIASAYSQDGLQCRDFLASYVRDGTESWLEGEACRVHQGRWEVRALKPWKRT